MTANPPEPRASVILPVFNGEPYVRAAIDSVAAQTYAQWELIIVDDGSTDGTPAAIAPYQADSRITIIRQPNRGLAAARNAGLAAARGAVVAFLDADDAWEPNYLTSMLAALDVAPSAVGAFCGWRYMDHNGALLPQAVRPYDYQPARVAAEMAFRNALVPSGVIARRQAVNACGGFDTRFSGCADRDLWLRLLAHGGFAAAPAVLVRYRTHGDNMSSDIEAMHAERLALHNKHFGPAPGALKAWPLALRKAFAYTYLHSALAHFARRQNAEAVGRLNLAVNHWPDLLLQDELYYELGCLHQPRGYRGTPQQLNLEESAQTMRGLLERQLAWPAAAGSRRQRWAQACLVLARLAALKPDRPAMRRFNRQALAAGAPRQKLTALRGLVRASLPEPAERFVRRLRAAGRP